MSGRIVFVPVGGLANRMRSMASAVALSAESGNDLCVVWFRDWALRSPFSLLFEPVSVEGLQVEMKEASASDLLLYDRPRKRNFRIPALFQKILFRSRLYEEQMGGLVESRFDFRHWGEGKGQKYLASCYPFYSYPAGTTRMLFKPLPEIEAEISRRCADFSEHTVGVHVRRTDSIRSIEESPLESFFEAIDREEQRYADLCIYLATDSEEVKEAMRKRYGNRVICCANKADRNTVSGIRDGVIDMYTLSRTTKIFGSFHSSFSELAAEIGDVPLEIVRKS